MDRQLDRLEQCMGQLLEEHERLLGLVRRKQEAMRLARPELVLDCGRLENEHVQRIGRLERDRQRLVGDLTGMMAPGAAEPLRLGDIAERIGEPRRGRLLVLREKLRRTMETTRRDNAVARRATEGLLRHVQGMIQQVAQVMGGAGTYGRGGAVAAPPAAVSSFSLTG